MTRYSKGEKNAANELHYMVKKKGGARVHCLRSATTVCCGVHIFVCLAMTKLREIC